MDNKKLEIGKRLAEIRKSKGLSQEEFKEIVGAPTVQMISGWENGHSCPSANYLIIFAEKLDISLDYLLLGKKNSQEKEVIITYKDAMERMLQLVDSELFDMSEYVFGNTKHTSLSSGNHTINLFEQEFENLQVARKTLRPELYNQAIIDLLNKYDIPIKNSKGK